MNVIVADQCGPATLPTTALTLELGELGDPVRYRWECPLCLTERWGRVSDVIAGVLAGRGVKVLTPLTDSEIDAFVASDWRELFLTDTP